MLTVSLHGIKIHAPIGLYEEEKIFGNDFETDVDLWLPDELPWPFADYSIVYKVVADVFAQPAELLEVVVANIYEELKRSFPFAGKIRVAVRKMSPPVGGPVAWSQVCYEQ